MHRLRKCVKNQFTASRNPCPGYDFRCAVQGSSQRKRAVFGGFRHKFYGTFCRSRSGEHIRVCPIPGNVLRKTPTPHGERRRGDKPESPSRTPGATPHQPHAHTRRNEISRSGGAPPHSDIHYQENKHPWNRSSNQRPYGPYQPHSLKITQRPGSWYGYGRPYGQTMPHGPLARTAPRSQIEPSDGDHKGAPSH